MRKPGPPREIPPPLELECLRALWKAGDGSVREVQAVLSEQRPLAYTTVMTLLDRLSRRGFATRRKVGRAFVYAAALDQARGREVAVQELVATWFAGSRDELARYLGVETPPVETEEPAASPAARPPGGRMDTTLL